MKTYKIALAISLTFLALSMCATTVSAQRTTNFSFTPTHVPTSLGESVNGIDNHGVMVGSWTDPTNLLHGFIKSQSFPYLQLDVGTGGTTIYGISSTGIIVGTYMSGTTNFGFCGKYDYDQNMVAITRTAIQYPAGVGYTQVSGVNDSGEIVGLGLDSSNKTHAFYLPSCTSTTYTEITHDSDYNNMAWGINNNHIITISSWGNNAKTDEHAYLYDKNIALFTGIDVPSGTGGSEVLGINNSGDVVIGFRYSTTTTPLSVLRKSTGVYYKMVYPTDYSGTFVRGINDYQSIVGLYVDSGSKFHGFKVHYEFVAMTKPTVQSDGGPGR